MLKPKKKITKKDIQRDPFLESVDQAQAHLEDNRSLYLKIGSAVLILIVVFNILSNKNNQQIQKASASLGEALITLDRDDKTTAQFQLETVLNNYDKTPASETATYFLGKMMYDSGQFEEAKTYLEAYTKKNSKGFLSAPACIMLSDISIEENNISDAVNFLDKGINYATSDKDIRLLKLRKASIELDRGNSDIAKSIVQEVLLDEKITSWNKQIAQEIVGRISG